MKKTLAIVSYILFSASLIADNLSYLEISGSEKIWLQDTQGNKFKEMALTTYKFNDDHVKDLNNRLKKLPELNRSFIKSDKTSLELGMDTVPVFDQGTHPTCVTFAVTAFLNASKKAGDFISQQCFLQLSQTIANYQCPNAWNGTHGYCLLNQAKQYGIINKKDCPNSYPQEHAGYLSINDHYRLSNNGQWSYSFDYNYYENANDVNFIKTHLINNKRVLISFLINKYNNVGDPIFEYKNGLWKLQAGTYDSKQICGYNMQNCAGHAVVVTGYDDDNQVFKVRNSWGDKLGAKGDYYMSYDYLRIMVVNAYTLR